MRFGIKLPNTIATEDDYETCKNIIKHTSACRLYTNQRKLCKLLSPVIRKLKKMSYCYHHAQMFLLLTIISQRLNHFNHFKHFPSMKCCHLKKLIKEFEAYLKTSKLSRTGYNDDSDSEEKRR